MNNSCPEPLTNEEGYTEITERTIEDCENMFVENDNDHKCANNKPHARNWSPVSRKLYLHRRT